MKRCQKIKVTNKLLEKVQIPKNSFKDFPRQWALITIRFLFQLENINNKATFTIEKSGRHFKAVSFIDAPCFKRSHYNLTLLPAIFL